MRPALPRWLCPAALPGILHPAPLGPLPAALARPIVAGPSVRVASWGASPILREGLEHPGYTLRGGRGAASLHGRIRTALPKYLEKGRAPFADWYNGAYVLESLPCALWCFLASPEDFEQTLFAAVDAGHDADTVAAMACSVSGAYHGYSRLPAGLLGDLEYHDDLVNLALLDRYLVPQRG